MNLRLIPPFVEMTPALQWVLTRAFAPVKAWPSAPVDGQLAWRLAAALDLACRIGFRVPREQLVGDLGKAVADRFGSEYHDAAASAMVVIAVAVQVVERFRGAGLPAVLLKSNALTLAGFTKVGARRFVDVDVLVPRRRAREAYSLLLESGYRATDQRDGAHQLASVFHPSGVMVEIHNQVKHMRMHCGGAWVDFEDLERAGHVRLLSNPAGILVPSPAFLAGHTLIHGLVHHWRQVGEYPLMRLLGDLGDIAGHWEGSLSLVEAVGPWLAAEAVSAEGQAVFEALQLLGAIGGAAAPARLDELSSNLFLRHVLASKYNGAYRNAVRAAAIFWVDRNRSSTLALVRKLRNRLFLSDASMTRRYGPQCGRVQQALLYFWRPFELFGKLCALLFKYGSYRRRSLQRRSISVGRAEYGATPPTRSAAP